MKKVFVATLFAVIVLAVTTVASFARPKADGVTYWYGSFGQAYIAPPEHPNMMVEVFCFKRSPFGPLDMLIVYIWSNVTDTFVPTKGVTDNVECAILTDEMFAGIPSWLGAELVEGDELEVWRRGKRLFADLTVNVPPDIPPSYIEFQGCGGAIHGTETLPFPSGYTLTVRYKGFNAFVFFVCHQWGCEWPAGGFFAQHAYMTIAEP